MLNNVVLQGKLGKDFDLKFTQSGKAVATTSIAVKRNFSDSQGNYGVDWVNIVFWGKRAKTVANHFAKGSEILVTGSIQTRSYEDNQGVKKYVTEVICHDFNFASGGNGGTSQNNVRGDVSNGYEGNYTQNQNSGFKSQNNGQYSKQGNLGVDPVRDDPFGGHVDVPDDSLPF